MQVVWQFNFRSILAMLVLCSGWLSAQSSRISGLVCDSETAQPLAGASVEILNSSFASWSADNGFFSLEDIPAGRYELRWSMLGYTAHLQDLQIGDSQQLHLSIYLTPAPLFVDSVTISASLQSLNGMEGERLVLTAEEIDRYRVLGLERVLQQVPGVQVEAVAGGSSRAVIRLHGSPASQVLVLLDGQRMNHPESGEVELADISLQDIERIEIVRQGNSALYGSNAFAGVVSLITRRRRDTSLLAGLLAGSWQTAAATLNAGTGNNRVGFNLSLQQDYSRQNFGFTYDGLRENRENAWYRNRAATIRLHATTAAQQLDMLLYHRRNEQGLPSFFYSEWNHFNAHYQREQRGLQLKYQQQRQRLRFSSAASLRELQTEYVNLQDPGFSRYHLQQRNRVYESNTDISAILMQPLQLRLGASWLREELEQENLLAPQFAAGRNDRDQLGIFGGGELELPGGGKLLQRARASAVLRYTSLLNGQEGWYPYVGISMIPAFMTALSLSAGWAKSLRYPDFNSLFWKGDARASGNPDLQPERNETWNASARLAASHPFMPTLQLYAYREDIRDLILWEISVGVWQPRNLSRARRQGIDMQIEQVAPNGKLGATLGYSFVDARNRSREANRYNRELIFVSRHTLNAGIWMQYYGVRLDGVLRHASERQVVQANTGEPLPAYQLADLLVSRNWQIAAWQLNANLALKNLTGARYELIRGYPMPQRDLRLQLQMGYAR